MRLLLTNDDGIHAEGLIVLEDIAKTLSSDITIVAPEHEQSGASHSLTLHMPVRVKRYALKRLSVSGTPTDCVLLAVQNIMKRRPTLVLSGVNRGSNVGDDITYSGTVAGAMEAAVLGIPSVALSQLNAGEMMPWETARHFGQQVIEMVLAKPLPAGSFWNINFPAVSVKKVKGIRFAHQGKRLMSVGFEERFDLKKRPYYWIGGERNNIADPKSDVTLLHAGYITLTPLKIDLTDYASLSEAAAQFQLKAPRG